MHDHKGAPSSPIKKAHILLSQIIRIARHVRLLWPGDHGSADRGGRPPKTGNTTDVELPPEDRDRSPMPRLLVGWSGRELLAGLALATVALLEELCADLCLAARGGRFDKGADTDFVADFQFEGR